MVDSDEYFGSPERIDLARRSASLWLLLRDNPRYAYNGRLVALSDSSQDTVDILYAMAKLQGAAVSYFYPAKDAKSLFVELEKRGLATDRHELFWGGEAALAASHRAQRELTLPADLRISTIDAATPRELVCAVAELCQSCDVMPVPGSIMRGQARKGICLVAIDQVGRPVATGSSYMIHHHSSPRAKDAFWGMLATREDRRGEKIALILGAQAIIHMWDRHGARGFMTGVRADNLTSQALCKKLGVMESDWICASCIDRGVLAASTISK